MHRKGNKPTFCGLSSKCQVSFRKCHSSQQCVSMMNRKWKKCLDNTEKWGTLWIDLSKSFACLYHDLSLMYVLMDLIR